MFKKCKSLLKSKAFAISSACIGVVSSLTCAITASAAEATSPYDSINTSMQSGFSDATDAMLSSISTILPFVLVIVGATLVITFGIRLFKKFSKPS